MKNLAVKLLSLGIISLLIVPSCKKDKDKDLDDLVLRIKSEKTYNFGQLDYEIKYDYTGNKLSKVTFEEGFLLITYPDNNTVLITNGGMGTLAGTISLLDNKVIEYVEYDNGDPDYRMTLDYNPSGEVINLKNYNYQIGWELDEEVTFTYSSGKLTEIGSISYWDEENPDESRAVYSYNGDNIAEMIGYYKEGENWVEVIKHVYAYLDELIARITAYENEGSWVMSSYSDFLYDSQGNLVQETVYDELDNEEYRLVYTYEAGAGNYRLFVEALDFSFGRPLPSKNEKKTPEFLNQSFFRTYHR